MELPEDTKTRSLSSEKRDLQQVVKLRESKSFNWTISSFTSKNMTFQLYFDEPGTISQTVIDRLKIEYIKPENFIRDVRTSEVPPEGGFSQTIYAPKMLDLNVAQALT